MTSIFQILMLLLDVAQFILIAHIIMSWLINFQVLNLRQPLVASIWDGLQRLPAQHGRAGSGTTGGAAGDHRAADRADQQRRRLPVTSA